MYQPFPYPLLKGVIGIGARRSPEKGAVMHNELLAAAIRPVKARVEDELIALSGVNMVDIAEKETKGKATGEMAIVVFVDKKLPLSKLAKAEQIPAEINGIKTDVRELSFELQPAWVPLDDEALVDPAAYPTLVGGISMGPSRTFYLTPPEVPAPGNYTMVGTLGALVKDNATGATMALSNFHVAAVNNSWSTSDRQVQPGRPDGGNPSTQEFGTLTRAVLSDNVDGTVTTLDAGKAWSAEIQGIGDVKGTALATIGMAVRKRGRTTELTHGNVVSVDATVQLDYGHDIGVRILHNQVRIATDTALSPRFSNGGDSGSVVVDASNKVVGLLFAGSTDGSMTLANPIAAALSELDVTLLVKPLIKPSLICAPSLVVLCDQPPWLKSRLVCPSIATICITKNVVCRSRLLCPTRVRILCEGWQEWPIPGGHGPHAGVDYGYGAAEEDDGQFAAYQAGYADGAAQAQAEPAPTEQVAPQGFTLVACPSAAVVCRYTLVSCPSRLSCPTRFACPTRFDCPTLYSCPTLLGCPTRLNCPTLFGCPSFGRCPTLACGFPIDEVINPGFQGETAPDQSFWAGYLAALEQLGEQEQ